jgi:catechol 2,3-dioxygenase-like lactoylglutathione lyase family enzyme
MGRITGLDHVSITVSDLAATRLFFETVFGARRVFEYNLAGRTLACQIYMGGSLLSIHQLGNGVAPVARLPTPGAADFCWRWEGGIESAVALLHEHNLAIVEGPSERRTCEGRPSHSVYFRDPDGNLLELMAEDHAPDRL